MVRIVPVPNIELVFDVEDNIRGETASELIQELEVLGVTAIIERRFDSTDVVPALASIIRAAPERAVRASA